MSVNSALMNLPEYNIPMPPIFPLMALRMTLGALAPLRILFLLGGVPWQLPQVLAT